MYTWAHRNKDFGMHTRDIVRISYYCIFPPALFKVKRLHLTCLFWDESFLGRKKLPLTFYRDQDIYLVRIHIQLLSLMG